MSATHVRLAVLTLAGLATGALTALAILPQARERLLPRANVTPNFTATPGQALIGGPFVLTDHTGKQTTDRDFRGRTMLVLFGYTASPDISPAALQVLSAALDKLGPQAARFVPVLITVDPENDTPERLKRYVRSFDSRLVGLTGSPAEITQVLKAYRIRRVPRREDTSSPAGYTIGHPALIYVMDPEGRFRTLLNFALGVDAIAASLAKLL
jgi:protein SCO1/2